jgi:hypothetical protein
MLAFNKITCKNIWKYLEQKNLNRLTCLSLRHVRSILPHLRWWGIVYRQRTLIATEISRERHDVSSGERQPLTVQCTLYIGNFWTLSGYFLKTYSGIKKIILFCCWKWCAHGITAAPTLHAEYMWRLLKHTYMTYSTNLEHWNCIGFFLIKVKDSHLQTLKQQNRLHYSWVQLATYLHTQLQSTVE